MVIVSLSTTDLYTATQSSLAQPSPARGWTRATSNCGSVCLRITATTNCHTTPSTPRNICFNSNALVTTMTRLRPNRRSTPIQPHYDHSTTYVTTAGRLPVCVCGGGGGLLHCGLNKLYGRPPQYAPAPVTLTVDLLTSKLVSESRVTCAISMPIVVFLCLSVLELGPVYATDVRQTDVRQHHRLMPPSRGRGHNKLICHRDCAY